ncbi:hypothetical protein AB0N05_06905 [Nocardia sp. NPDC051030]|uniref:hypothetical protein n=1 Tax=Nocardia sp. NPDC051030 TaxID=3155162 RepID=UPI0034150D18
MGCEQVRWSAEASRQVRWFAVGVVVVALAGVVAGCTGAPDRREQATTLVREIEAMPGVSSFSSGYNNEFERGANLDLQVSMPDATAAQIEAVVTRINDLKGTAFEDFRQTADFHVGMRLDVRRGTTLDPAQIAADAQRIRAIAAAVPNAQIDANRGEGRLALDIREVDDAQPVLTATRDALAAEPAKVEIIAKQQPNMWGVSFPFTIEQQNLILAQLSQLPRGANPWTVDVTGDYLSGLSVNVGTGDSYRELIAVIDVAHPTPEHPLWLRWAARGAGEIFKGSADIGGCRGYGDSNGEKHPEQYLTPDAVALQQRIRAEYDTCAR